jgi:hypothetical protein
MFDPINDTTANTIQAAAMTLAKRFSSRLFQ